VTSAGKGVLYHLICAAPPALDVTSFIRQAKNVGWDVCVITTPRAAGWVNLDALASLTGHPVRTDYKLPDQPDVLPPPNAIAVAPATFNTINKWAAGIADNLVLGLLTEAIGLHLPIAALPYINAAQADHPAFGASVDRLRTAGITVLLADTPSQDGYHPHPPGQGDRRTLPWQHLLDALG
jgi:phosphopantothenoylcysteine synthetase/decarboxylase